MGNVSGRILPLPGRCSCPPRGQRAGCRAMGYPARHGGMQVSPVISSLQVTLHTGLPVPEFYASRSAMP